MDHNKILMFEQIEAMRAMMCSLLNDQGFHVTPLENTKAAFDIFHRQLFDLVICDVAMVDPEGAIFCQEILTEYKIPLLFLCSQGEDEEILDWLELGTVDFIMQPIRPYDLIARVRSLLKRTSTLALPGWLLQCGELTLDLRSRSLVKRGARIPLSRTDMRLLSYLIRNAGCIVRKEDLLKNVWQYNEISGDHNLVDTAIKRLRQAIEDDPKQPKYIRTVWGQGYRMECIKH